MTRNAGGPRELRGADDWQPGRNRTCPTPQEQNWPKPECFQSCREECSLTDTLILALRDSMPRAQLSPTSRLQNSHNKWLFQTTKFIVTFFKKEAMENACMCQVLKPGITLAAHFYLDILATFQGFNSHTWWVATGLDSVSLDQEESICPGSARFLGWILCHYVEREEDRREELGKIFPDSSFFPHVNGWSCSDRKQAKFFKSDCPSSLDSDKFAFITFRLLIMSFLNISYISSLSQLTFRAIKKRVFASIWIYA